MSIIYISEPDAIDLELVVHKLKGTPYTLIEGDPSFGGAPFESCEAILIRSKTHITSNIRTYFPNLKAVIRVGTGLDTIDTAFCRYEGIAIFNSPGANADAVAEYVIAVLLHSLRKIHVLNKQDISSWNRFKFVGQDIASQTVGIVGYGNIGKRLHQKLAGLGCHQFLVYDPYLPEDTRLPEDVKLVTLDELLSQSTVISLHLPLTTDTSYIIGKQNIRRIRQGAILINAARGGIVDEQEVLRCIDTRQLTYIADTVEDEPAVNPKLLQHSNVIITPHIASLTETSQQDMVVNALDNFLASVRPTPSRIEVPISGHLLSFQHKHL